MVLTLWSKSILWKLSMSSISRSLENSMRSLVQGIMGVFIFQKEICAFRSLDQLLEIKITLYIDIRQHIKKQRHHFANKGLYSQSYGFSSSHVWMWDLDHKDDWAPKNWCIWIMVLEKTLDYFVKEVNGTIKFSHFHGRTKKTFWTR